MQEILEIVKERLEIEHSSLDKLIMSYVKEVSFRIKHYCNIDDIPEGLYYTWASMVIDILKVEQSHLDEIAETLDNGQSIKIGDTSVAPAKVEGVTSTSKKVIEDIVLNYQSDLIRYRKLRW